jgi:hypothetical protein
VYAYTHTHARARTHTHYCEYGIRFLFSNKSSLIWDRYLENVKETITRLWLSLHNRSFLHLSFTTNIKAKTRNHSVYTSSICMPIWSDERENSPRWKIQQQIPQSWGIRTPQQTSVHPYAIAFSIIGFSLVKFINYAPLAFQTYIRVSTDHQRDIYSLSLDLLYPFPIHLAFSLINRRNCEMKKLDLLFFTLKISLKSHCNYISVAFDICTCFCVVHNVISWVI